MLDTIAANFPKCWLALLLSWSPYAIASLPGVCPWDITYELAQGLGMASLSSHHPVFVTLLYTAIFKAGFALGGVDAAALSLTVFQLLVCSAALAWCLSSLAKLGLPRSVNLFSLVFLAFVPVFPCWMRWVYKDPLAAVLFCVFITQIVLRMAYCKRGMNLSVQISLPALVIVGLFCCLTRNDSVYVVLPTMVVLAVVLLLRRERRKAWRMLFSLCALMLVFAIWSLAVLPALDVSSGKVNESLSLPLQMTARCLAEHPDDLTSEERKALEAVATVSLDELASSYKPWLADPVKSKFDFSEDGSLARYFEAWLSMGLRHPGVYLASFLEGTIGYWYPFSNSHLSEPGYWGGDGGSPFSVAAATFQGHYFKEAWLSEIGSFGTVWFPSLYESLGEMFDMVRSLPVVGQLFVPATYCWVLLFLLAYMASRKNPAVILGVPFGLKWLVCLASPVSCSVRYALPLMVCVPVLLAAVVLLGREEKRSCCSCPAVNGKFPY